jgi:hypothetical protein
VTGWICDERRGQALRDAAPHIRQIASCSRPTLPTSTAHVAAKAGASAQRARIPADGPRRAGALSREDPDALATATTSNASRFFGLTLGVAAGAPDAMPQLV